MYSVINELQDVVDQTSGVAPLACENALQDDINQILVNYQNLADDLLSCGPMNNFFNKLINEAMCNYGFNGFYQTFGLIYFIAFFFFIYLGCMDRLYRVMPAFEKQGLILQESEHFEGGAVSDPSSVKYSVALASFSCLVRFATVRNLKCT